MNLFVFFAIPLATILIAIVLEKILDSPVLVAMTIFAIGLIGVFGLVQLGIITDLGAALALLIVYTLLAFITAYIVRLLRMIMRKLCICCRNNCRNENLQTINCRCNTTNNNTDDLLTTIDNNNVLEESTTNIEDDPTAFRMQ